MGSLANISNNATPPNNYKAPTATIPSGDPNDDPNNPFAKGKLARNANAAEIAGLGVRAVGDAVGSLADTATALDPVARTMSAVHSLASGKIPKLLPSDYSEYADKGMNALHVTQPLTNTEKLGTSAASSAIQFAVPVGGEAKLGEMAMQGVVGAGVGAAQEAENQAGVGEGTQTATGLVLGTVGLVLGHHFVSKWGANTAKVVAETNPEHVITEEGHLTEEGQEQATKLGLDEDQYKQAIHDAVDDTEHTVNKINEVKQAAQDIIDKSLNQVDSVGKSITEDHPLIQEQKKIIADADTTLEKIANKEPLETPKPSYDPIEPTAPLGDADTRAPEQRIADAKSLGEDTIGKPIKLSLGQATRDATQLKLESNLKDNHALPASADARAFTQEQVQDTNSIADALKKAFDDHNLTKDQVGSKLQEALIGLKQRAYETPKELYKKLSIIKNAPLVDIKPISDKALEILHQYGTGDNRAKDVLNILGKYNGIPKEFIEETTHNKLFNRTKIKLNEAGDNQTLQFEGKPEKLTLSNAVDFNARLNRLYKEGEVNPHMQLKSALQQGIEDTIAKTVKNGNKVGQLAKDATQSYKDYQRTFNAKDIIGDLTADKGDGVTPKISPDKVIDRILDTKDSLVNLKKTKTMLMSSKETKPLWHLISQYKMADIMKASYDGNNVISATKLNNQIKSLGKEKLQVIFEPSEYNNLMKLNRLTHDLFVTGKGTQAALKSHMLNIIYHAFRYGSLAFGHGASHAAALISFLSADIISKGKTERAAVKVLNQMLDAEGALKGQTAKDAKGSFELVSNEDIKDTLDYLTSPEYLSTIIRAVSHKDTDNASK